MKELIPVEIIESKIYLFRGHKVMLDRELAELYMVPTRVLLQAVKRNIQCFPEDFMFQLDNDEFMNLRSQIVTSSSGHGGRRYLPYVFTEQGVAMLSSVLNSERAVQVNIAIMRTFVKLRQMLSSNAEMARKLEALKRNMTRNLRLSLMRSASLWRRLSRKRNEIRDFLRSLPQGEDYMPTIRNLPQVWKEGGIWIKQGSEDAKKPKGYGNDGLTFHFFRCGPATGSLGLALSTN